MNLEIDENSKVPTARLVSNRTEVGSHHEGFDLLANAYFLGVEIVVTQQHHFSDEFYHLSSTMAGEILQKFVNYGMQLVIEGKWTQIESRSLKDFMTESNRGKQILFIEKQCASL